MLDTPQQSKPQITKEDIFLDEAIETEEYQSLESGSVGKSSSNKGRNSYENKPNIIGKTADNLVQFNENIGLLTPKEVKKLEKYGKIIEIEETTRELEQLQEILVETMPEDSLLIDDN